MNQALNQKIKKLYLDWIARSEKIFLVHANSNYLGEKTWTIYENSIYQKQKQMLQAFTFQAHQIAPTDHESIKFLIFFNSIDFFSNNKDWIKNRIVINHETELMIIDDLVLNIYNNLDENDKKEFLSITPRLFSYQNLLKLMSKNPNMFKSWVLSPYRRYIQLMSHTDFSQFLKTFENIFKDSPEKEKLLLSFLKPREKNLLKRIESQNMLRTYLRQYFSPSAQDSFSSYIDKTNNNNIFNEKVESIGIVIDKIGLYNNINSGGLALDKNLITNLLTSLVYYINNSIDEKLRLSIEEINLIPVDPKIKWYTIVINAYKDRINQFDYSEFLKEILLNSDDFFKENLKSEYSFKEAISSYIMNKKLHINKEITTKKINKI